MTIDAVEQPAPAVGAEGDTRLRQWFARRSWYRWYALGVLTLVYTSSHVDRQIVAILLEPIGQDLGASDTQLGFLVGLTFAVFYATLGIPIAMIADRSNRRNIITAAVVIWSGMTVLCGYAQNFLQLALARIGVGVGEAGSSPPSHSLISDLFPASLRATALGIFAVGVNLGVLIAYLGGGFMSEAWGWRWTLIAVGLPGLLIAAITFFTLIEPRRGASETKVAKPDEKAPPLRNVWRKIWRTPALRHLTLGAAVAGFSGYGIVMWTPTFLMRSHGLSPAEVGIVLALMSGVLGGIGTYSAGYLADGLAKRDERWRAWVVGAAKVLTVPFFVGFFMAEDTRTALLLFAVPAFLSGFSLGPTFALVQSLVDIRMRAVASSILLFLLNIIGMGLGPQVVGILSDLFSGQYADESLRMALLVPAVVNIWCGFHYYLAGRALGQAEVGQPY